MTDDDLKSCVIDSDSNVKSSDASNVLGCSINFFFFFNSKMKQSVSFFISENSVPNSKLRLSLRESLNGKTLEEVQASPKCQLISAMKKCKSTGNIVKKVAFSDDLPSMKTVPESNLLQVITAS